MAGILQLDSLTIPDWRNFKKAFTAKAVREIHEAVIRMWPPDTDLSLALQPDPAEVRALYVGDYEPELLARGVTRHCLYADKITLVDPFVYSVGVKPEYNPLEYPEHYRSAAIRCARMWFQFIEWIDQGLVEFIRTPGDLDRRLWLKILKSERERFESSEELKRLTKEFVNSKKQSPEFELFKRYNFLLFPPDGYLRRTLKEFDPAMSEKLREDVMTRISIERDEHPYYVEPIPDKDGHIAEMQVMTTGMGHLESRLAASLMHGYLVTDIPMRWRMIEMDREYEKVDSERWSPLAKAFGGLHLHYLNDVGLSDALRLRQSGRLAGLRSFLRRVFQSSASPSTFSDSAVADMASELTIRVDEAEVAWNEIDRELLKWAGAEGVVAIASCLATGGVAWTAAGLAIAGGVNLGVARWKRCDFPKQFPASFFMDLRKRNS